MKVVVPNNNKSERQYIIEILLGEFLGLDYELEFSELVTNWEIILDDKKLVFQDSFFSFFKNDLEYLALGNLPDNIILTENQFLAEEDIPILYGPETLTISEKEIYCGMDIFASSFFMLTRWEEYVNTNRDEHNRFSAKDSIAYKNSFLERPIVNEYVEMLKKMLSFLKRDIVFKKHHSKTLVSCDVDEPFDCTVRNLKTLLRVVSGDIMKRNSFRLAIERVKRYYYNKRGNYKFDNKYTFDWYMSACESNNLRATFYFIPDNTEKGNGCYSIEEKRIIELMKTICERGHEIGVHGSYQTYNNQHKAKKQKQKLETVLRQENIPQNISGNRQHYLRWDSSITPSVLDFSGFDYDTSGGYADVAGFRYGVCYEFPMFDFMKRRTLEIRQRPLVVMECTVIGDSYMGLGTGDKAYNKMVKLKNKCYQYDGLFTLLWHNSYFKTPRHKLLFEKILKEND